MASQQHFSKSRQTQNFPYLEIHEVASNTHSTPKALLSGLSVHLRNKCLKKKNKTKNKTEQQQKETQRILGVPLAGCFEAVSNILENAYQQLLAVQKGSVYTDAQMLASTSPKGVSDVCHFCNPFD